MPGIREDAWLTLNPVGANSWRMTNRGEPFLNVVGRLRPGVNREMATQDLDTIMRRMVAAYPNEHIGVNTITIDPMWRSPFGANGYMAETLPILLAIAGVVLLLTCANVATLTLVRFVSRRREMAIRLSLGANRVQLMRQMLLEGAILSLCAGAVALLLTSWTAKAFGWFIPPNSNPMALSGMVDYNVVLGIVGLSILAGVLCGAFPAWRSSNVPAVEVLKEEAASVSGGSRNRHLISGLVVVQIALSLALLVSSGLFLQTLHNISDGDPGFEQDHILTASVGLNIAGYSNDEAAVIRRKILDRVSAMPGVTVASLTDWVPMSFTRKTAEAYPTEYVPRPHESLEVRRADVTPRYFETLGIPIIEGRDFTQDDNEKAPRVLILDETAAHRFWPGQNPVGKKLSIWGHPVIVVGVVKNSKHQFMNERLESTVYMNFIQDSDNETIVQVRTKGNPMDLAPSVERAIHEIDGRLPVFDVRSMRETTQVARIFLRGDCAAVGSYRHLRGGGVPHKVTDARDWSAHGSGCFARGCAAPGAAAGNVAYPGGTGAWAGCCVRADALHRWTVVWSECRRSDDGDWSDDAAGSNIGAGLLSSGASSDACRSGGFDSGALTHPSS
jgi:predicted permease